MADLSTALSTTTMVSGWPDAIKCDVTNPNWGEVIFYMQYPEGIASYHNGKTVYRSSQNTTYDIIYNADKTFSGYTTITASNCNQSIATLYANGQAFNFLGNNGAQISLTEITDVSASTPTEGQLLSYDASEGEWVVKDVISETIILNSADDNPCVVTGSVRKLSFNPSTGRLRICRP